MGSQAVAALDRRTGLASLRGVKAYQAHGVRVLGRVSGLALDPDRVAINYVDHLPL